MEAAESSAPLTADVTQIPGSVRLPLIERSKSAARQLNRLVPGGPNAKAARCGKRGFAAVTTS